MEKIVKIDLNKKEDIFEKYNNDVVDDELIDYIIDNAFYTDKNEQIKLILNNYIGTSYKELIIFALKKEYDKGIISHIRNNARQIVYLLIGGLLLFISTLIERTILKEIILIGAWVLIWEMMELVIFSYTKGRRKRNIIKKIIDGEIIENIIENNL